MENEKILTNEELTPDEAAETGAAEAVDAAAAETVETTQAAAGASADAEEITAPNGDADDAPDADADDTAPLEPARFVARTTINAATQLEASKMLAPKISSIAGIAGIALMVVLLGITLWQYFTVGARDRLLMAGLLVVVIGFLVYSRFAAPKRALKRWEAGMRRSYGTDALHLTTEFFDHSLAQSYDEGDDLIVEGYSKLSELRETEHLLLLRCSARQWFFIDKNGFTTGDAESFKAFIRDRIGDK